LRAVDRDGSKPRAKPNSITDARSIAGNVSQPDSVTEPDSDAG